MINVFEDYEAIEETLNIDEITELVKNCTDDKPRISDFFDVEQLKKLSPEPPGKNCKFVRVLQNKEVCLTEKEYEQWLYDMNCHTYTWDIIGRVYCSKGLDN